MDSDKNHPRPAIGFLTVIEHPQHGLFGGYLVLNLAGRPLEFHCTAPIKPNRAQQILYGPTLESFLYGEQIGSTLLGHAKTAPLVICTDREPVLSLRELVDVPIALVLPPEESQESAATDWEAHPTVAAGESQDSNAETGCKPILHGVLRADPPHGPVPRLITFELGRNRLALSPQKCDDRKRFGERLGEAAAALDLWEPFTRIREAIEEARQAAR
ncbi:MAG: hypothetical protein ACLP9L_30670 [Thermoguttaceae bacterium]